MDRQAFEKFENAVFFKIFKIPGYNTNAYKKPEPIRYISSELLLSTTVGDTHTIIQNH